MKKIRKLKGVLLALAFLGLNINLLEAQGTNYTFDLRNGRVRFKVDKKIWYSDRPGHEVTIPHDDANTYTITSGGEPTTNRINIETKNLYSGAINSGCTYNIILEDVVIDRRSIQDHHIPADSANGYYGLTSGLGGGLLEKPNPETGRIVANSYQHQYYHQYYACFDAGDCLVDVNIYLKGNNKILAGPGVFGALQYQKWCGAAEAGSDIGYVGDTAAYFDGVWREGKLRIMDGSDDPTHPGSLLVSKEVYVNSGAAIGGAFTGYLGRNGWIVIESGNITALTGDPRTEYNVPTPSNPNPPTLNSDYSYGSYGAAIGGGGCSRCGNITINGGTITARASATPAAIGGGGGQHGKGCDAANIVINGGTVNAYCRGNALAHDTGVGIGAGSGLFNGGGAAKNITINGGTITVYKWHYTDFEHFYDTLNPDPTQRSHWEPDGAIGGGNSNVAGWAYGNVSYGYRGDGGDANITITGGNITAGNLGGGSATRGIVDPTNPDDHGSIGGNVNLTINMTSGALNISGKIGGGNSCAGDAGSATINIIKGTVNAGSIGGGDSTNDGTGSEPANYEYPLGDWVDIPMSEGKGGDASVTVLDGLFNVSGKIGGGNTAGTGDGGNASIYVTGGELDCGSVGGGDSNLGNPGSVSANVDPTTNPLGAGVYIAGSNKITVKSGYIGGGTNSAGDIGKATAYINATHSESTIQGQFILSNNTSTTADHCFFIMEAGTFDNTNLGAIGATSYPRKKAEGGAVYMNDLNGEVNISGGTIKNSTGTLGGAIYMTGGSFEMTGGSLGGTSVADANVADNYGGALYMAGGQFTMKNGSIQYNKATNHDGGGVYIASGGTAKINGGTIEGNQALNGNGGGFFVNPGAGKTTTINSDEGNTNITGNKAKNGGGAYVGSGKLNVASTNNNMVSICNNTATENGGALFANSHVEVSGSTICDNKAVNGGGLYLPDADVTVDFSSGTFSGNYASQCGGGIYLSDNATLNLKGTATLTLNHVPADGDGGGVYLDGTLNVGDGTTGHTLKIEDNYAGTPSVLNNVFLPHDDDVITLLSDISGKDIHDHYLTHIGFSVNSGFRKVVYSTTEPWLSALMGTTSTLVSAIFDDAAKYIAVHLTDDRPPFENEYIYLWGCWTTAVTSNPGTAHIELVGDTYHIKSNQGLAWFTSLVNGLNHRDGDATSNLYTEPQTTLNAVMESDVNMEDYLWVPIGGVGSYEGFNPSDMSSIFTPGGEYKGVFDGQGHIISGLDCRYITSIQSYGLFGNMTGGEVYNTFVKDYKFFTEDNGIDYLIGGIAGHMSAGVLRNCEAQGTVAASTCGGNTAVGGLVGLAETSATIHSSMAMPYIAQAKASISVGGLVGKIDGTDVSLKNSFSNAKFGTGVTHNVGGLVGDNSGTVENCYVRLQGSEPDNFGWFAGSNSGTIQYCYAPTGKTNYVNSISGTPTLAGHGNYAATALVNGKYGYAHQDQEVTATNGYVENGPIGNDGELKGLLATLNNWVEDQTDGVAYSTWTRTMASPINADLPILEFDDFACASTRDNIFIAYRDDLNDMISYANGNATGGSVYLYDVPGTVTVANNANVKLFINEHIGFLQSVALQNVRTGITLDNSSSGFMSYDWHMFSPALTDAPMGLTYNSMVSSYPIWSNYNGNYLANGIPESVYSSNTMNPPATDWKTTAGTIGYFPTNTPYGAPHDNSGCFDFYCYYEPYTHWVNFKREGTTTFYDHWRQNADENGNHQNIPYENETTMKRGKGYMVAITEPSMLMTDGTLDNNQVTVEVSNTTSLTGYEAPLKGVNLIGNPYQAYLDFNKIGNDLNTYFILDAEAHGYIAYVSDGSTPDEPGVIRTNAPQYLHPHQGFFVRVPQGTTSLILDNTMIEAGDGTAPNSTFRSAANHYPMVTLAVEDGRGRRDYTTVELDRPETGGGEKIQGLHAGDASLWVRYGEKDWQVAFTKPGLREVPVRFEAYKDGTFTLSWGAYNGYFSYLHLIDNLTGADIDCLQADEYRFEAKTSDYTSRFRLVFDFTGVEENDEPTEGPTTFAFMMGDELIVNGVGVLQMFDLNGRQLLSTEIHGTQATVAMPKVADGLYVLRLTNGNQVRTQKMVINK